jgi:hypothetical protein
MASSFLRFLHHTQRRTTVGRTPVGFEPTITAGERPQTYALERAATGTGYTYIYNFEISVYAHTRPELAQ